MSLALPYQQALVTGEENGGMLHTIREAEDTMVGAAKPMRPGQGVAHSRLAAFSGSDQLEQSEGRRIPSQCPSLGRKHLLPRKGGLVSN